MDETVYYIKNKGKIYPLFINPSKKTFYEFINKEENGKEAKFYYNSSSGLLILISPEIFHFDKTLTALVGIDEELQNSSIRSNLHNIHFFGFFKLNSRKKIEVRDRTFEGDFHFKGFDIKKSLRKNHPQIFFNVLEDEE